MSEAEGGPVSFRHRREVSMPRSASRWQQLAALILLASPALGWSDDACRTGPESTCLEAPGFVGAAFRFEEDAFLKLVPITDRNYTGGGAITLAGNFVKRAHLSLPLDFIDGGIGLGSWMLERVRGQRVISSYSTSFGVTAFTPADITNPNTDPGDRPYASFDFLAVTRTLAFDRIDAALTTELRVGMLGLDQGHQIQAGIHRFLRNRQHCVDSDPSCTPHDPKGWSHQISAGGEPTAGYTMQLEKLLLRAGLDNRTFVRDGLAVFELKSIFRGDVGHLTAALSGVTARIGLIQTPYWAFNPSPILAETVAAATSVGGKWRPELYFFGSIDGRATLYNALLQGQFRHSDVAVSWKDFRVFGYDYSFGVAATLRNLTATWIIQAGRSPEAAFREERMHLWGAIVIAWTSLG